MGLHRLLSRLVAVFGACALVMLSSRAMAATITILNGIPATTVPLPAHPAMEVFWISRDDCLQNQKLRFSLSITDGGSNTLEVWVGKGSTDCNVDINRTTGSAQCSNIYRGPGMPYLQDIEVAAQDLAAFANSTTISPITKGDASSCNGVPGATEAVQIGIFFISIASTQSAGSVSWTQTSVDLVGPSPPTDISIGFGSTYVKMGWGVNTDADVYGYQFFCDPPRGSISSDASPPPAPVTDANTCTTTTGTTTGAADGDTDAGSDDASEADGSDAQPASAAPAIDACVADAPPSNAGQCGGFALVPGTVPTADQVAMYQCGSVGKMSTSFVIDSLQMNTQVGVAVASYDVLGNVGPLSSVVCATPTAVNGFDELYHQAGGTGGGGYCSMGYRPGRRSLGWGAFSFVLLGTCVARRRRRQKAESARIFDTESHQ